MTTLGILASGRGSNCRAILRAVAAGELPARVAVVLSDRPEAPVLEAARAEGIEARYLDPGRSGARLTSAGEQRFVAALQNAGVDWVVLAGFMRIVGPDLLEAYPQRIVNIHPSLLPAFPGLNAQNQAWTYGVRVAGATVHLVDRGVDTGPIVMQAAVSVLPEDTAESLSQKILAEEHRLYPAALKKLCRGNWRLDGRRIIFNEENHNP